MSQMVIKYSTLSLAQQLLERQQGDATQVGHYLSTHADIGDSTGALLSLFDPLSCDAVSIAARASAGLSMVERAMAAAIGDTANDLQDTDSKVHEKFGVILNRLGAVSTAGPYSELGGPRLGNAESDAGDGYGDVDSSIEDKLSSTVDSVEDAAGGAKDLLDQAIQGSTGTVTERADVASYLVAPRAPEDPVGDLRWSAGALLGSIDWVAEKFIGFSILDRCVFHPLAGDWQGIYRCSEAWHHAADAVGAIAKNHSGLVADTPPTWKGESGDAFRVSMITLTGVAYEVSTAFALAGDMVKTISTVTKLACIGIGAGLKFIADRLLEMAENASVPLLGWAKEAFQAYGQIQDVIAKVRLINTILQSIASAIQGFVAAKTSIVAKAALVENLVAGAAS